MFTTIVGVVIFLYFKPQIQGVHEYPISSAAAEAVRTVHIIRQQKEIVLKQLDHRWRLIKPVQAQADEKKVKEILEILTASSNQRFPLADLERFDLDRPHVQVYFDREYFGFGRFAPITHQQYVMTNDGVYLISPRYALALPLNASDLISQRLLASHEIPVSLELKHVTVALENGEWRNTIQNSEKILDAKTLEYWVHLWQTAQAKGLALEQELGDDLVAVGDIKIGLRNEQKIALEILQNETEIVFFRTNEGIGYYFSMDAGRQLLDPYAIKPNRIVPKS
jgi:hypothetical protein